MNDIEMNLNDTKEEKSLKEQMISESLKRIKNPFINLTVADVAKDLKM